MTAMVATRERYPAHVPTELIWDHDIDKFSRELDDPYLAAARLHDQVPDIVWATGASRGRPGWLLTRHADIRAVYMDNDRFSASEVTDIATLLEVDWKLNPQEIDPPRHLGFRQILQPWFQPSAIASMDQSVRESCRSLIADLAGRNSCDFVADFAKYLPSRIFLKLMDLPLDRMDLFLEWEHELVRGKDFEARQAAAKTILAYLEDCVEQRRAKPGKDLISHILAARIDGRPLDHGEIMGMCMVLYGGGLDTVLGSLGWHMYRIATNPDLQAQLRARPELIGRAADELLRAHGVVQNRRTVAKDCEFNGISMKKGDWVVLPTYLASRDARAFPDPHRIDLDRKLDTLTFGTGVHNCLGIHLARREVRIVLEEFLPRFSNIRIADGDDFSFHTTSVWGVDRLPIAWDAMIDAR